MDYKQGGGVFVYSSPYLFDESKKQPLKLYECPVGMILREASYIYDLLPVLPMFENTTPEEWNRTPRFVQRLASLYSSEMARIRELERAQKKGWSDAQAGARARAGSSHGTY